MKKNLPIIFLLIIFLTGCAGGVVNYRNAEPDDNISESMLDFIGDDLTYLGKDEIPNEGTRYNYLVRNSGDLALNTFINSVSTLDITDENGVVLAVHEEISNGVLCVCFFLSNYDCWGNTDSGNSDNLDYLKIRYNEYNYSEWNEPKTYTAFSGIRYLEIPDVLQKKAEEEGIDWYEVWPELEEIVIIDSI